MAQPRGICPQCGRNIALDDLNQLWGHNPTPNSGGARVRIKRTTGTYPRGRPICLGSGKKVMPQP